MSAGEQRGRVVTAVAVAWVATVFVASAWLSWRRLGSLIIDWGRELDVPRRLLEGATLYQDVRWYWGPLAPWINELLYRLFGVTSDTLMWSGIATAALACAGLFLIARRFVGPVTSAWVAVAFIVASAFAKRIPVAIFNFVAPFNFSATYGIALAIWSVLLLLWARRDGRDPAARGLGDARGPGGAHEDRDDAGRRRRARSAPRHRPPAAVAGPDRRLVLGRRRRGDQPEQRADTSRRAGDLSRDRAP